MINLIARFLTISFTTLLLVACAGAPPNITIPATQPLTTENIPAHPRVVLVLGGGGARGIAHAGVIEVLSKADIPIDLIVGTSAGSIMGALYADQGNSEQLTTLALNTSFISLSDLNNLPKSEGLLQGYKLQKFLLNNMKANNFNELKIPLIAITTDLKTGDVFPISSGPIAPAVQASGALPGLFDPVQLYGHTLNDGGVSDPIAVDIAQQYKPDIIIAVNISEQLPAALPTTAEGIYNRAYLISRINISQMCMQGADVKIQPDVGNTGVFDTGAAKTLYAAGVTAAEQALPQIKLLLKEKNIPLVHSN